MQNLPLTYLFELLTRISIDPEASVVVAVDDAVLYGGSLVGIVSNDTERYVSGNGALRHGFPVGRRDEHRSAVVLV